MSAAKTRLHIEEKAISPKLAMSLLAQNDANRPVRKTLAQFYARQMRNGRWRRTHQPIAVTSDGKLIDGQHRLLAIVQSGVTVTMPIATGVSRDSILVVDQGAQRSAHDAIHLAYDSAITARDVSTARVLMPQGTRSPAEIYEFIVRHERAFAFLTAYMPTRAPKLTSASVRAVIVKAWHHMRTAAQMNRLAEFCQVLTSGIAGPEDAAAVLLRDWLMTRERHYNHGRCDTDGMGRVYSALRAFLERKPLTVLRASTTDPFPLLDELAT